MGANLQYKIWQSFIAECQPDIQHLLISPILLAKEHVEKDEASHNLQTRELLILDHLLCLFNIRTSYRAQVSMKDVIKISGWIS